MSFTLFASIVSPEPGVAIFLGPADPAVEYEIHGIVHLDVKVKIEVDRLVAMFNGEAKRHLMLERDDYRHDRARVNIARSEFNIITQRTVYEPGKYDFPFTVRVPGDVAVASMTGSMTGYEFAWIYEIVALVQLAGSGANSVRVTKTPIKMKRVYHPPSTPTTVAKISRAEEFTCTAVIPKFIDIERDTSVHVSFKLDSIKPRAIKSIRAEFIENNECKFDYARLAQGLRRFWNFHPTAIDSTDPSNPSLAIIEPPYSNSSSKDYFGELTLRNPLRKGQKEWGQKEPIEMDIKIKTKKLSASESVEWWKITHGIRFIADFVDGSRTIMFTAPVQVGHLVPQ